MVVFASFVPQYAHTTTNYINPKQEQSFPRSLRSYLTSFTHSFLHLPCPQKKITLHGKNIRQPCVFNVGCQSPYCKPLIRSSFRFFPFRLSLPATFVPLAIGSRLSLRQAGKALHFVPLLSHLPSFGSRLLYLLCFRCAHFLFIRHSQIPLRFICLCSHFVRQFRFAHAQPPATHP